MVLRPGAQGGIPSCLQELRRGGGRIFYHGDNAVIFDNFGDCFRFVDLFWLRPWANPGDRSCCLDSGGHFTAVQTCYHECDRMDALKVEVNWYSIEMIWVALNGLTFPYPSLGSHSVAGTKSFFWFQSTELGINLKVFLVKELENQVQQATQWRIRRLLDNLLHRHFWRHAQK